MRARPIKNLLPVNSVVCIRNYCELQRCVSIPDSSCIIGTRDATRFFGIGKVNLRPKYKVEVGVEGNTS